MVTLLHRICCVLAHKSCPNCTHLHILFPPLSSKPPSPQRQPCNAMKPQVFFTIFCTTAPCYTPCRLLYGTFYLPCVDLFSLSFPIALISLLGLSTSSSTPLHAITQAMCCQPMSLYSIFFMCGRTHQYLTLSIYPSRRC
jgi:hypothetical protein